MKKLRFSIRIFMLLGLLGLVSACLGSDAVLGKAVLARGIDSDGMPVDEATIFHPGETVMLALQFTQGYEGLEAKITWKQDERVLQTSQLSLSRQASTLDPYWMTDQLVTAADWTPGEYRCEYFVPDQGTNSLSFTLEEERSDD